MDAGYFDGSWMLDIRQRLGEWEPKREREMACWPSSAAVFSSKSTSLKLPDMQSSGADHQLLRGGIFQFAYPCCDSMQTFPDWPKCFHTISSPQCHMVDILSNAIVREPGKLLRSSPQKNSIGPSSVTAMSQFDPET